MCMLMDVDSTKLPAYFHMQIEFTVSLASNWFSAAHHMS